MKLSKIAHCTFIALMMAQCSFTEGAAENVSVAGINGKFVVHYNSKSWPTIYEFFPICCMNARIVSMSGLWTSGKKEGYGDRRMSSIWRTHPVVRIYWPEIGFTDGEPPGRLAGSSEGSAPETASYGSLQCHDSSPDSLRHTRSDLVPGREQCRAGVSISPAVPQPNQ